MARRGGEAGGFAIRYPRYMMRRAIGGFASGPAIRCSPPSAARTASRPPPRTLRRSSQAGCQGDHRSLQHRDRPQCRRAPSVAMSARRGGILRLVSKGSGPCGFLRDMGRTGKGLGGVLSLVLDVGVVLSPEPPSGPRRCWGLGSTAEALAQTEPPTLLLPLLSPMHEAEQLVSS